MNRQISTFLLGDTLFGVEILLVKEIYRHMSITKIPDAPAHLRGLLNLRGKVVTVIDLNVCLNRPAADDIRDCRLLILKTRDEIMKYGSGMNIAGMNLGEDIVGFLIDGMDDVLTVGKDEILPPPPNLVEVDGELIEGVIKLGEKLVLVLDVTEVLNRVMNVVSKTENRSPGMENLQ